MRKYVIAVLSLAILILAACAPPEDSPIERVVEPTETPVISEGIEWDEAASYIGEYQTVCGPVVDTYYASGTSGQPTFLNIGEPYPDPGRFTIVIWERNRDEFSSAPERFYDGERVCVHGLIEEYEGAAEIVVDKPAQIEIK